MYICFALLDFEEAGSETFVPPFLCKRRMYAKAKKF
ncbi:hypothetical protein IGI58_002524 [Enterococcus sp. AZ020]|uniref:Uncharacterized protein n=1 Tax=Candidatus Enterococcus dunnyi TaxID=1834192 RepID=A0A200JDM0_9ENTE|nr:hypothetical protein A5889_000150 [Enterococcus sp. 9D6_DIV0238]